MSGHCRADAGHAEKLRFFRPLCEVAQRDLSNIPTFAFISVGSTRIRRRGRFRIIPEFEFDAKNKIAMQKFDCTAGLQAGSLKRNRKAA